MPKLWSIVLLACSLVACAEDELPAGKFPCGDNGGSCTIGDEVCVVVDGCSTCLPAPEPCEGSTDCSCIETATDADATLSSCYANGICEVDEDGLSISCEMSEPMLGCG